MKKAKKENATSKRSYERKRTIVKKYLMNIKFVVAIKEHLRVFILGLSCKTNALYAEGEGA
jgi:hypothetical protein